MSTKPFYESGLRFECTQCGNCCKIHGKYAYVYMREDEVTAIADYLQLSEEKFREQHCEEDEGWTIIKMDEPACPFLDEQNRCKIYPVRPKQCATWPFWDENLKEAIWNGPVKDCCPGIGKGELRSAEEVTRIANETSDFYDAD